jgi:IS30 family transposase
LEIDTVIGKNRKGLILTINERKTGFVWIHKLPNKEAKYVAAATEKLLMPFKGKIHTITSDNGTEFADHQYIAQTLGIDFYFATPYHSWERGANENLNGLIRQYLPKWETMEHVTQSYLEDIARKLNQRPRKRLGYMTPEQAMKFKDLEHMKKAFNIR